MNPPLFEIGQKVIPLKGFSNFNMSYAYGGKGWIDPDDLIKSGRNYLIITRIGRYGPFDEKYCYFFKDWDNKGIIEFALEGIDEFRQRRVEYLLKDI